MPEAFVPAPSTRNVCLGRKEHWSNEPQYPSIPRFTITRSAFPNLCSGWCTNHAPARCCVCMHKAQNGVFQLSACIYSRTQGREKATNSVTAMLHHPLPETAQSIRGKKRSQSTTWLRGRKIFSVFQTFSAPVVALALISCQIQGRAASRQGKVENRALLQ